jgi:hypothetical protein
MAIESKVVGASRDISFLYSPSYGGNIIPLVVNDPNWIKNKFGLLGVRGYSSGMLDELRCYASISSLPEVELPAYSREDGDSANVLKAADYEWGTARFELTLWKKAADSANWAEFGVTALKNAGGFRYRLHRILDLLTDNIGARIGEWGQIGVSIKNVGYGFPQSFDRISITGHWVQEYVYTQEFSNVIINQYGSSPTPSPTPTPVVTPTVALTLPTGITSASANTDTTIGLSITGVPTGTSLVGYWYKDNVLLSSFSEAITVGTTLSFNASKLGDYGAGNYKLQFTYQGTTYTSNAVPLTVSPVVTLSLPTGVTSALTGSGTTITVTGKWFASNNVSISWQKNGVSVGIPSFLVPVNGVLSGTFSASIFQSAGTGTYRLVANQNTVDTLSNTISVTQTLAPTIQINANTLWIRSSNAGLCQPMDIYLKQFVSGEIVSLTWMRETTELTAGTFNKTIVYTSGTDCYFTFAPSLFNAAPYSNPLGGNYKLKAVNSNGLIVYSNQVYIVLDYIYSPPSG